MNTITITYTDFAVTARFYPSADNDLALTRALSYLVENEFVISQNYDIEVLASSHQAFLVLTRASGLPALDDPDIENVTWVNAAAV